MRLDSNKTLCSFYCTVQSVLRYVNNSLKFKNNQYEIYIQSALNASNLFRWCQWLETIDIFIKTDSQNTITDYRQNHQKWPTSNKQPTYLFNQVLYLLGTKISFMMLLIIGKFPKIDLARQKFEDYLKWFFIFHLPNCLNNNVYKIWILNLFRHGKRMATCSSDQHVKVRKLQLKINHIS